MHSMVDNRYKKLDVGDLAIVVVHGGGLYTCASFHGPQEYIRHKNKTLDGGSYGVVVSVVRQHVNEVNDLIYVLMSNGIIGWSTSYCWDKVKL